MKLLCVFVGHDWVQVGTSEHCQRCKTARPLELCKDCGGSGSTVVCPGGLPEHGSVEQEACSTCDGAGVMYKGVG